MHIIELSGDQRRQLINAKQAFGAWRATKKEFEHSYRGEMRWRTVSGHEYLSRKYGKVWHQVGRRSPETERIKEDYTRSRTAIRARLTKLDKHLEDMRAINRAMGLGRVPDIAAKVLRKLDDKNLLGRQVSVAGIHALYAYEARAGVIFDRNLTATTDIDFLWDARARFTFLMQDVYQRGVMGLLQQVDPSFRKTRSYRAENADAYLVELIRPPKTDEIAKGLQISATKDDLEPTAIEGLEWIVNSPKLEEIVMGDDGRPLLICCVDPRVFALHKLWLSRRPLREPLKAKRDEMQAIAVAAVAKKFMGLKFDRRYLSAIPTALLEGVEDLQRADV
jgi:hypothetical protein